VQLDKLLQSQGFGSRKYCQALIQQGQVKVAGQVLRECKSQVQTEQLQFQVFDTEYRFRAKVYLALHKPQGYECSQQPQQHPSVFTLLPEQLRRRGVQCVGRLDQDTTGLLLLSDDGQFVHQMTHPRQHVNKYYHVHTADPLSPAQLQQLQQGVRLHQEKGSFASTELQQLAAQLCRMAIDQGVYHQVKRMFAAVGNRVTQLHRAQIGLLDLQQLGLSPGQWCYLEADQIAAAQQLSQSP
jgi:16S rRNA pseudouridine516 synthase